MATTFTTTTYVAEPYVFQDHEPGWMPGDFRASRAAPTGPHQRCRCTIRRADSTGSVNMEPGVLLDSGSCLNVCPPDFALMTPLLPIHDDVQAYAVNGQPIRVFGAMKIRLRLESGYVLDLLSS